MKVKDLIDSLSKMSPDCEVLVFPDVDIPPCSYEVVYVRYSSLDDSVIVYISRLGV